MDQRFRKFTRTLFVFALGTGLLSASVSVRAENGVDEKIRALENELTQLKAQQVELRNEAKAAADALPEISYRPGRGMRIRSMDRSWSFNVLYEAAGQMGFFPGNARSVDNDTGNDGPSQGAMVVRKNEIGFTFGWDDDLFQAASTFRFDTVTPRSKSERIMTNFNKFSPWYPRMEWVHTSMRPIYDPVYNSSSASGTTMERASVSDSLYATASTKGVGLIWEDMPMWFGTWTTGAIYGTTQQSDSKTASNSNSQRAFMTGVNLDPFSAWKDSLLAGLNVGVGVNADHTDNNHGRNLLAIGTAGGLNGVDVWGMETRGQLRDWSTWLRYEQGPIRWGSSYSNKRFERDFTGDAANTKKGDSEINTVLLRAGLFVWGPKGFLTGDENGGLMLAFNHFRNYFDAGSGFATSNSFSAMRHMHYIENIGLLRWFYRPNLIYSAEYYTAYFSKMNGSGDAADARRRLGIGRDGGTYQQITLQITYNF